MRFFNPTKRPNGTLGGTSRHHTTTLTAATTTTTRIPCSLMSESIGELRWSWCHQPDNLTHFLLDRYTCTDGQIGRQTDS